MFAAEAFLAAIVAHLQATFPTVPTVEEYTTLRRKIGAPAIFVEFADGTQEGNPGTEQLPLAARFEARVVFDMAPTTGVKHPARSCLALALSVAQAIFKQGRFGPGAGSAGNFRVEPDSFKPELAGYAVYLVEWTHEIRLGDSIWDGAGVLPTEIWVGYSPEIGAGHEADYTQVEEAPGV